MENQFINGVQIKEKFPELLYLVKTKGTITAACEKLNIRRRSIYKHLSKEELEELKGAKQIHLGIAMSIPDKSDLFTVEGFNALYEKYLLLCKSSRAAYELSESEIIKQFNTRKYSNYESFRNARYQWYRLRKKNRVQSRQAA